LIRDHFLVQEGLLPLYEAEQVFRQRIHGSLAKLLKSYVVSAVLFGSVAAKSETSRSDFDICCIVRGKKQKEEVRAALESRSSSLLREFGIRIAPLILTLDEFRRGSKKPLVQDIVHNGKLITGKHPENLLNG
jgi:predicted nucleotidyltransferase